MDLITLECKRSSQLSFDRGSERQKALDGGKIGNGKDYKNPIGRGSLMGSEEEHKLNKLGNGKDYKYPIGRGSLMGSEEEHKLNKLGNGKDYKYPIGRGS